jgi:hypothetical protein
MCIAVWLRLLVCMLRRACFSHPTCMPSSTYQHVRAASSPGLLPSSLCEFLWCNNLHQYQQQQQQLGHPAAMATVGWWAQVQATQST